MPSFGRTVIMTSLHAVPRSEDVAARLPHSRGVNVTFLPRFRSIPRSGIAKSNPVVPQRCGHHRPSLLRASAAVVDVSSQTRTDDAGENRSFSWQRQWWPVAVLQDLELQPRHTLHLLGTRLLVWRKPDGSWTAFEDRCPHRGAPLSSGQVMEDGRLECAAHAWQFDAGGACTKIPQIKDPEDHQQGISSPAACAVVFPTSEADGLLWVWAKGGPAAQQEAAAAGPPLLASLDARTGELAAGGTSWYCRDLPLQWATMLEGALDPSRFKDQRTMAMDVALRQGEGGIVAADFDTPLGPYTGEFRPPGTVRYDYGPQFHGVIHVTPTAPGQCRWIMATWSAGEMKSDWQKRYYKLESDPLLSHMLLRSKAMDFDLTVLAVMEQGQAQAPGRPPYEPASADLLPAAFRTWLQRVGGPPPAVAVAPQDTVLKLQGIPERQLLDRFNQHVKICSVCSQAFNKLQGMLRIVNVLLPIAAALAVLSFKLQPLLPLPLAAIAAGLAYWRHRLLGRLEWFEYVPPVAGKAFEFP